MKNTVKIFDQIFSTLLDLEETKKHRLNEEDFSFGFCSDLDTNDGVCQLFLLSRPQGVANVFSKDPEGKTKCIEALELLKAHFESGVVYNDLPTYFEAKDHDGEPWRIKKCGKYYVCTNPGHHYFGKFSFTRSKKFADFWIEQKKSNYLYTINSYKAQLAEAEQKAKSLRQYEIPRYKKTFENFNFAKFKLWLIEYLKSIVLIKEAVSLNQINESIDLEIVIEVDPKDEAKFTAAVIENLKKQATEMTGDITPYIYLKSHKPEVLRNKS